MARQPFDTINKFKEIASFDKNRKKKSIMSFDPEDAFAKEELKMEEPEEEEEKIETKSKKITTAKHPYELAWDDIPWKTEEQRAEVEKFGAVVESKYPNMDARNISPYQLAKFYLASSSDNEKALKKFVAHMEFHRINPECDTFEIEDILEMLDEVQHMLSFGLITNNSRGILCVKTQYFVPAQFSERRRRQLLSKCILYILDSFLLSHCIEIPFKQRSSSVEVNSNIDSNTNSNDNGNENKKNENDRKIDEKGTTNKKKHNISYVLQDGETNILSVIENGMIGIADFENYSFQLNFSFQTAKEFITMIQETFPLRVKAVFVINAPKIMELIMKLILPLMDKVIRDRFFVTSEGLSHFNNEQWNVSLQNIPEIMGGQYYHDLTFFDITSSYVKHTYECQMNRISSWCGDPTMLQSRHSFPSNSNTSSQSSKSAFSLPSFSIFTLWKRSGDNKPTDEKKET
ncbi:hypothetical protein RFI_08065 [Reticulomyxa filosa]|uniref:CRAL-TRIO domain-containing protein n=1 Tax=Reticulomyxa filosa TaxID=46433 RepID=X6NUW9_RETFI|nr:hypothetical protein RFI_08065 [Reticulomyxa filosa]|eukprot:ETO29062.1 hypothetical protein RFI_08065 [Reticulomyxa filosa]